MSSPVLLADLLEPDLRLVFCGTALGRASYLAKAYYARAGNRFWPTLAAIGLTPRRFLPQEYPLLLQYGIGLTDLCKTDFGNDDELPEGAFDLDGLREKVRRFRPQRLAFTSKTAGQTALGKVHHYGRQPRDLEGCPCWVLPSPSGRATRFWNLQPWQELADDFP